MNRLLCAGSKTESNMNHEREVGLYLWDWLSSGKKSRTIKKSRPKLWAVNKTKMQSITWKEREREREEFRPRSVPQRSGLQPEIYFLTEHALEPVGGP